MVEHVVFVQETVVKYSKEFLLKLRRVNYVTPKNYLDFINTYTKLLEEKDKYVLEQVGQTENVAFKFLTDLLKIRPVKNVLIFDLLVDFLGKNRLKTPKYF